MGLSNIGIGSHSVVIVFLLFSKFISRYQVITNHHSLTRINWLLIAIENNMRMTQVSSKSISNLIFCLVGYGAESETSESIFVLWLSNWMSFAAVLITIKIIIYKMAWMYRVPHCKPSATHKIQRMRICQLSDTINDFTNRWKSIWHYSGLKGRLTNNESHLNSKLN